MKYGLTKHTIDAINSVFEKHEKIEKVLLYGSRAKNTYRNGSDIDITLIAPKLTIDELLKIDGELDDLLLPYKIDLSIYHQLKDKAIIAHIERVGLVFYSK